MDTDDTPGSKANPKMAEALFSSRQRIVVRPDKSSMFLPTDATISKISVAYVPKMQDLYPDFGTKTYPNVFARTKISFGAPDESTATSAAASAASSAAAGSAAQSPTEHTPAPSATATVDAASGSSGSPAKTKTGGSRSTALGTAKAISALSSVAAPDAAATAVTASAASSARKPLRPVTGGAGAGGGSSSASAFGGEDSEASSRVRYSQFIADDEVVLLDIVRPGALPSSGLNWDPAAEASTVATASVLLDARTHTAKGFIRAGPRAEIVYDCADVRAAIVTCGSLCPGHNDVVEELFNCLHYNYGVDTVYGIKGGFRGFWDTASQPWEPLTPEVVRGISGRGGSILGTAKGGFDAQRIVNACEVYGVTQLYIVGGDGTHRAALQLHAAVRARPSLRLALSCVPNSLDNDVGVIDNSFGFSSAVQVAARAIESVQVESMCAPNGIGIVQLMGKHAGYIAAHAVLAARDADLCLIPELPFRMYGRTGVLEYLRQVVQRQGYAVVVVSEGAGAPYVAANAPAADESAPAATAAAAAALANPGWVMPQEQCEDGIGQFLKTAIADYFKSLQIESTIRCTSTCVSCAVRESVFCTSRCISPYPFSLFPLFSQDVDPSYMIRSIPASAADSIHCLSIAHNAVHAVMAGYTAFSSGIVNNRSVLVPIELIGASSPSALNPRGRTWERVLSLTQQPSWTGYERPRELAAAQEAVQDRIAANKKAAKLAAKL
jgi:6-phosphofructokinase 1